MNWKAVFVLVFLGILAWSRPGHAEKVKTNQSTTLYSRAGEQSPVVLKLKAGQSMTVLAKDGRWIKVRVSGRTGWIPRSKVDLPNDDEELARNTRRRPFVDGRSTNRGPVGESGPDDRIGADATGAGDEPPAKPGKGAKVARGDDDDAPSGRSRKQASDDDEDRPSGRSRKASKDEDGDETDKGGEDSEDAKDAVRPMAHVAKATSILEDRDPDSDTVFTAQPRTALYILGQKGKYTMVENDEGDAGFILTSKLDIEAPAGGGGPRKRSIDLRARLGGAIVAQSVETTGGMAAPPDNYTARSSALTVALGAQVLYPYSKRYWLGGEFAYDFNLAYPGIGYMNQNTGFSFHNLNLRGVFGYDLQRPNGMLVLGRFGLHYDSYQVSNVADFNKNPAKIPNQIIAAPAFGGALVIPRLTKDIGIKFSLDFVPFLASVSQTKNLEDGTSPSARAIYLGGAFTYRLVPKMDFQATLDIDYTSLSFGGVPPTTSMRGHTGTNVPKASDYSVTASFGIAYAL